MANYLKSKEAKEISSFSFALASISNLFP